MITAMFVAWALGGVLYAVLLMLFMPQARNSATSLARTWTCGPIVWLIILGWVVLQWYLELRSKRVP